ncbi:MAG TPA: hypothetical protein VMW76_09535 [Bacteroidales bacterium]|nr:hypothetical protein [Bacteroidales bacterium]
MKKNNYPEFRLDSFNLVNFLFRYWKIFLWTAIAAFIISASVSLTMKPLFRSTVTLYPASSITHPGSMLFTPGSNNLTFGDEEGTEKILQILQSDKIVDYLIEKYDLLNHYDIDPEAKYRYTMLVSKMNKYISFSKTRYMSVQLSVMDEDPVIAASMANDIATLIDSTFNKLISEAGYKQLEALGNQYNKQLRVIRSYEDSLMIITSSDALPSGIISSGLTPGRETRIQRYSLQSPDLIRFSANHENAIEDLAAIRQKYTEASMAAEQDFPYTLVVNEARVSEKKAFPKRSIITIASTAATLLFVMFVLIFVEGLVFPEKREE